MTDSARRSSADAAGPGKGARFALIQRAFRSFLGFPSAIVGGFLLLAWATYALDHARIGWLGPVRTWLGGHVFGDPQSTAQLLGTIASGLFTVTSITFSLLLLALQQAAASMTHQVFDQFLRRRLNQIYFGFFVGLTLYALVILATVDPPYNPIFGATLALLLVVVALYLLLLMIYSTVTQMRPDAVVESIHDYMLRARERQLALLHQTYRARQTSSEPAWTIRSQRNGFVVGVDAPAVGQAITDAGAPLEVVCLHPIGSYVAFADPIAAIYGGTPNAADELEAAVRDAIQLDRARNLEVDPAYGLEQLANIAWTSISTSKQNPAPGLLIAENLRDLAARWAVAEDDPAGVERVPLVYPDDVVDRLFGALESLVVVSTESMQHQVYAAVMRSLATVFDRLPAPQRDLAEALVCRALAGLGDHVLTAELDGALTAVADALAAAGRAPAAAAVRTAQRQLGESVGILSARGNRVPS